MPGSRTPAPATPARVLLAALGVLLLLVALLAGRMTHCTFLDMGTERFREALPSLLWAVGIAAAACLRLAVGRGPWALWLPAGAVPAIWEAALHLGA